MIVDRLEVMGFPRGAVTQMGRNPPYRRKRIPKKHGSEKTRGLALPSEKLQAVLTAIKGLLSIPTHPAAHGFIEGRSIATAAREHANSAVVLNFDLTDFYDYCTLDRVQATLFLEARWQNGAGLQVICFEDAALVAHLACFDGKLAQGSPLSPMLSNLCALDLDRRLSKLAGRDWRYTRFGDDITFSHAVGVSREQLDDVIYNVKAAVRHAGFKVNPKKTTRAKSHQRQEVLGLIVNGPTGTSPTSASLCPVRVPRKFLRELRAALHIRAKSRQPEWNDQQIRGAIAFVAMVDPEKGKKLLDDYHHAILAPTRPNPSR